VDKIHRQNRQAIAVKGDLKGYRWVTWRTKSGMVRSPIEFTQEAGYQAEQLHCEVAVRPSRSPAASLPSEAAYR
jgi:hypothetical protein